MHSSEQVVAAGWMPTVERVALAVCLIPIGLAIWAASEAGVKYYGFSRGTAILLVVGAILVAGIITRWVLLFLHRALLLRIADQPEDLDQPVASYD